SSEYPSATSRNPINTDPRNAAKPIEQIVRSWDVTLPRTRTGDHPHAGPVRAIKFEPRARFVVSAGDDRLIRVWDRGGDARWSVGYLGVGSLYGQLSQALTRDAAVTYVSPVESGSFDPSGAALLTRLPDRTDIWDATSGECRNSFAVVL